MFEGNDMNVKTTGPVKIVKQKKKKITRACEFCRRRKLKCDQMRPLCSTCRSRGFGTCEYNTDNPNLLVLRKPVTANKKPNVEVDTTFESTSKAIPNNAKQKEKDDKGYKYTRKNKWELYPYLHKNTYKDNYFLQTFPDGSRIIYGPTSLRQLVFKRYPIFLHSSENPINSANEFNQSPNVNDISKNSDSNFYQSTSNLNIPRNHSQGLAANIQFDSNVLIYDLPSFDTLLAMINRFFHVFNKGLYPIYSILDEQKVLNDFYSVFIPDNKSVLNNGERPLLQILVNVDNHFVNNYKIGIILLIVVITSCWETLPKSMHDFFTLLNGTMSMKCMFVERLQFLLLQYYTKSLHSSIENSRGNDDYYAELVNIADRLITGAMSMGLHYDIKQLYKGQEQIVGNLENLNNLRLWIVLVDFEVALKLGRPLMIKNTTVLNVAEDTEVKDMIIDEDGLTTYMTSGDKQETIFFNKLKKFLRMARPIISNIYDEDQIDLRSHIECIFNFMATEFGNLEYFIDFKQIKRKKSFKDYFLLSLALHLAIILLTLANEFRSKEMHSQLKHEVLPQVLLFSLRLMRLLMQRALNLDRERFPELIEWKGNMSPYMISTLFIINNLLPPVLIVFHLFIYGKVSSVNSTTTNDTTSPIMNVAGSSPYNDGYVMFSDLYDAMGIPYDAGDMTVLKFFDTYKQIIDEWWGRNNVWLRSLLLKNRVFTNLILLESNFRSVVEPFINLATSLQENVNTPSNDKLKNEKVKGISPNIQNQPKLGSMPSNQTYIKPIKPVKTTREALKMFSSFSIGRTVNSAGHSVRPTMFQEFQVSPEQTPLPGSGIASTERCNSNLGSDNRSDSNSINSAGVNNTYSGAIVPSRHNSNNSNNAYGHNGNNSLLQYDNNDQTQNNKNYWNTDYD